MYAATRTYVAVHSPRDVQVLLRAIALAGTLLVPEREALYANAEMRFVVHPSLSDDDVRVQATLSMFWDYDSLVIPHEGGLLSPTARVDIPCGYRLSASSSNGPE